uniref:EGF-like domain-containing protein n=1 Tax=Parascaris univalens TaxID=6257 RepID=A0A915ABW2_PARUN
MAVYMSTYAIANVFSNSIEKLKKILGLTPECLNGGTKTMRGECICPKYYKGKLCQEIVCVNNGTRVKVTRHPPAEYVCKCPHPEYISGAHCELVRCMNGGRAMDNGHCRCLDYWYTGQFCQNYTASWGAVLGVPLACIVVIIICCVVCRLDLCPRKQTRQRRRRRAPINTTVPGTHMRRRQQATTFRDESSRRGFESSLRLQENLLNEENPNLTAGVRPDPGILPSYVIRLDTIPVFNPRMVGGVGDSELKPIDPPPPYEQAIASSGRNDNTGFAGGVAQRPPEYTPRVDQPPPPNFRPPDTPREQ